MKNKNSKYFWTLLYSASTFKQQSCSWGTVGYRKTETHSLYEVGECLRLLCFSTFYYNVREQLFAQNWKAETALSMKNNSKTHKGSGPGWIAKPKWRACQLGDLMPALGFSVDIQNPRVSDRIIWFLSSVLLSSRVSIQFSIVFCRFSRNEQTDNDGIEDTFCIGPSALTPF